MKDFRGNEYQPNAQLGSICSVDTCIEPAVRHRCNAEGGENRTHWHGEIHRLTKGSSGSQAYCGAHGIDVLRQNADIISGRG